VGSGRPAGRLRGELTEFVERRAELALVRQALGDARLVTLTGPGGIGKTRLALQAASGARRAFRDGVWLAELGGLRDPALLVPEVARSLGLSDRSGRWAVANLSDYLTDRHVLLVVDQCEHLADAYAVLADVLLRACPQLPRPAAQPAEHRVPHLPGDPDRDCALRRVRLCRLLSPVPGLRSHLHTSALRGALLRPAAHDLVPAQVPRWWFDWNLELQRFTNRVGIYMALMDERYPSTDDHQSAHLDYLYPDDLNRWLPLVKWLLAIPHYIVLFFLNIAAFVVVIVVWFAILFHGRYPRGMFGFVEGVIRWNVPVTAYTLTLVTDRYPPFRLAQ
jgi:hypothetical protein